MSRSADLDAASALPEPVTAVVVHPPPCDESPADGTGADDNEAAGSLDDAKLDSNVADRSSFSLFSMLTRWNKEGDDELRLQEFQEQVHGSGS
jgi:hypothetical protein